MHGRSLLLLTFVACEPNTLLVGIDDDPNHFTNPTKDAGAQGRDARTEDASASFDGATLDGGWVECPTEGDGDPIFLVTREKDLLSFAPKTQSFTTIGKLGCPTSTTVARPHAMAVDRKRTAWVMYENPPMSPSTASTFEGIYRVDTASGGCAKTSLQTDWTIFGPDGLFGLAFTTMQGSGKEALFASDGSLARLDLQTGAATFVGDIEPMHESVKLTGTGDGRLFAYLPQSVAFGASSIVELDKSTADVLSIEHLALGGNTNGSVAIAFWGGDLYAFVGMQTGGTNVHRYRLHDKIISFIGSYATAGVVSAAVSTCAPTH
jgi:hypothetical protein